MNTLKQGIGGIERSDGSLTSDESEMAKLAIVVVFLPIEFTMYHHWY